MSSSINIEVVVGGSLKGLDEVTREAIGREMEDALNQIRGGSPTSTGRYQGEWRLDRVDEDGAVFVNGTPYALWVRRAGARQLYLREVYGVLKAAGKRSLERLALTAPVALLTQLDSESEHG